MEVAERAEIQRLPVVRIQLPRMAVEEGGVQRLAVEAEVPMAATVLEDLVEQGDAVIIHVMHMVVEEEVVEVLREVRGQTTGAREAMPTDTEGFYKVWEGMAQEIVIMEHVIRHKRSQGQSMVVVVAAAHRLETPLPLVLLVLLAQCLYSGKNDF